MTKDKIKVGDELAYYHGLFPRDMTPLQAAAQFGASRVVVRSEPKAGRSGSEVLVARKAGDGEVVVPVLTRHLLCPWPEYEKARLEYEAEAQDTRRRRDAEVLMMNARWAAVAEKLREKGVTITPPPFLAYSMTVSLETLETLAAL